MKNLSRTFSPAAVAAALALLAAAPQAASAQAVGAYLGRGGGQSSVSTPAPNQVPPNQAQQAFTPMRSGVIPGRQGGMGGSPSAYSQPIFSQPSFNQPSFSQPSFNQPSFGSSRFNGLSYGSPLNMPTYNSAPVYGNGPGFRTEGSSGPAVNVPDQFEDMSGSGFHRLRPGRFSGSSNGVSGLSDYPFGARNGYSINEDNRPVRPIGPAYGYPSSGYPNNSYSGGTDLRITTPVGQQFIPPTAYSNNYIYNNYNYNNYISRSTTIINAPPLLGGYYYGNYCNTYVQATTYPSIYCAYDGFPQYIYNSTPNIIIVGQPMYQPYVTPYLPFDTPNYSVTYNQNNYYVSNESRAREIEGGGAPARAAIKNAYPADSYQAAFADIARAWTEGDIAPLRKHIRDSDTRISVFLNKKYSYSIASGDFSQITRDALNRLHTVSFDLTRLRKSKTGDVTAYGTHIYRTGDAQSSKDTGTVPFDQNGTDAGGTGADASPYDKAADPVVGAQKTIYVSYTLRHRDGQWYIVEVDSSDHDLVPAQ